MYFLKYMPTLELSTDPWGTIEFILWHIFSTQYSLLAITKIILNQRISLFLPMGRIWWSEV